jgi:hypothetical protein
MQEAPLGLKLHSVPPCVTACAPLCACWQAAPACVVASEVLRHPTHLATLCAALCECFELDRTVAALLLYSTAAADGGAYGVVAAAPIVAGGSAEGGAPAAGDVSVRACASVFSSSALLKKNLLLREPSAGGCPSTEARGLLGPLTVSVVARGHLDC